MKKDDSVYLKHILDAICTIEEYLLEITFKDFLKTRLIQDGVIRQIEIIGEATKRVTEDTKSKYAEIPWKDMAGMRDKLIHNYFGVDIDAVWKTTKKDIPLLKIQIKNILEES